MVTRSTRMLMFVNEAVIADDHAAVIATNSASEPDSFRANGVKENIKTAAAIEIANRKRQRPTAKRRGHGSGNEGPRLAGYVCPTKIWLNSPSITIESRKQCEYDRC
jgi:hypothetical protein